MTPRKDPEWLDRQNDQLLGVWCKVRNKERLIVDDLRLLYRLGVSQQDLRSSRNPLVLTDGDITVARRVDARDAEARRQNRLSKAALCEELMESDRGRENLALLWNCHGCVEGITKRELLAARADQFECDVREAVEPEILGTHRFRFSGLTSPEERAKRLEAFNQMLEQGRQMEETNVVF
jgi:hypothetical protein